MSNLNHAIIEDEILTVAIHSASEEQNPKPFLVSHAGAKAGALTRRVETALDVDFANGSMPA